MDDLRVEHKYLVPDRLREPLRSVIAPFVRPDRHASPKHDHGESYFGYTVRSIYYDSSTFDHFFANESGLAKRAKPRIRGYDTERPDSIAFLEIKRRCGSVGSKTRAPIAFRSLAAWLDSGETEAYVRPSRSFPAAVASANQFMFRLRRFALRPVVLVTYDREPYVGTIESSLRITLDSNLRSAAYPQLADLYRDQFCRASMRGHFVLEIKHHAQFGFPAWLRPFMGKHSLVKQSLSKYCTCLSDLQVIHPHARMRTLALAEDEPRQGSWDHSPYTRKELLWTRS